MRGQLASVMVNAFLKLSLNNRSNIEATEAMNRLEIYTTPICGFCRAAKRLLDQKDVKYIEYEVNYDLS